MAVQSTLLMVLPINLSTAIYQSTGADVTNRQIYQLSYPINLLEHV